MPPPTSPGPRVSSEGENTVLITLLSESQAQVGKEFVFLGPQLECKECRLKGICFNLEKGASYRVVAVRNQKHPCELNEGEVHVVEVERITRPAAVEKKYAVEGSKISFQPADCGQIGCPNYRRCNPVGMDAGAKVEIKTVGAKAECPLGQSRVLVDLL